MKRLLKINKENCLHGCAFWLSLSLLNETQSKQKQNMNAKHTIQSAIARSISHTETVAVTVEAADIYEVLAEVDSASESLGHAQENDGTYDVFGEDHGGNEFRLRVTESLAEKIACHL